jgi:hypothetical protein
LLLILVEEGSYEMGGASSKQGSKNILKQETPKGKIYFGKLGVDGKIL